MLAHAHMYTHTLENLMSPRVEIMNKASGGDGIPVEFFQILKDDAVKVLHSICQQIWWKCQFGLGHNCLLHK